LERQINVIDVLFDSSAAAGRALEVAAYLARQGGRLNVFVWAERDEDEAQLRKHIKDAVKNLDGVIIQYLQAADPGKLIQVLRRQRHGLLVLGMTDSALPPDLVEALLEDGGQQILAVR
jgi:hypothetical protein